MNSLVLGAFALLALYLGYKFYGAFIERKLIRPNDKYPTPAFTQNDGVDYSPARTSMLFGHHFSSIAGAGPIIGPLIGVTFFGWLVSSIWIIIGSIFIGAVHDYTSMMLSVRNKGKSIAEIAGLSLGLRARNIFSIFLWIALVLVVAAFGDATAQTLVKKPEIVIPTFGLIFLAIFFGNLVYKMKIPLLIGTLFALAFLAFLVFLGETFPISVPETIFGMSDLRFWFWILMIYALIASVIPVWVLLQPRDYISSWLLYLGLGVGFLGLIVAAPAIQAPALVTLNSPSQGPLWPMLFVLIACGAVSGFHCLVSGGTTSKQLAREGLGKRIGYGSMILEAVLAIMVVMIAASALNWDPSAMKSEFGLHYLMKSTASGGGGGPIVAFATGFGKIVSSLPGITIVVGIYFGMLMLNAFVITTLDTATRLGRFMIAEVGSSRIGILNNRWIASLITVAAAGLIASTGGIKTIWPVFGATNQLVAALALVVVSAYLIGVRKPGIFTVVPAILMLVTTIVALCYKMIEFFGKGGSNNYVLGSVSVVLIILAIYVALEAKDILLFIKGRRKPITDAHPAWTSE
ncbi:MAG: carbon starvation protein A [Candidatus Zixiibacteriota bacterium]|nr:MAG: carbon starvation protein A [candidate division Zixibacteria bacterium]